MNDFTIDIEKHLSRLGRDIQEFVEKVIPVGDLKGDFSPACDIVESGNRYRILMDLPGLDKKDIQIKLKDQVLSISGERLLEREEDSLLKRSERKGGAFFRSFSVPENIDASDTEARFRNGVLTIILPKKTSAEDEQSIPVR